MIKSYTDISQSKKLAEFLPLESADYTHLGKDESNVLTRTYFESCSSELKGWIGKDEMYPCWSLAALLKVLPEIRGSKPIMALAYNYITYPHISGLHTEASNPVDACVAMIEKLHELNLL